VPRGDSDVAGQAPLDHADSMHKGKLIRVFVGLQRGFMHESSKGEVRPQQTIERLLHQFRGLAPQYDLGAPQMSLPFIQGRLDFPPLVVERRQLFGRRPLGIAAGG